jgi:signal transduction histidine kinase
MRLRAAGAAAVAAVEDDGPGIPADEHDRVFQRFYRLTSSRSTPGNGLGLALVAAIGNLHNAKIQLADSQPGLRLQISFERLPHAEQIGVAQKTASRALVV